MYTETPKLIYNANMYINTIIYRCQII